MAKGKRCRWKRAVMAVVAPLVIFFTGMSIFLYCYPPLQNGPVPSAFMLGNPQFAHNGGDKNGPEDTLEAIRDVIAMGIVHGVEVDVQLTKDNVLVMFHDAKVSRATGASGRVRSFTYDQLSKLDASMSFCRDCKNKANLVEANCTVCSEGPIRIPRLSEGLELILAHDLLVVIEVKFGCPPERTAAALAKQFAARPELYEKAIVISFFPFFLYRLRQIDPKIATALLYKDDILEEGCLNGVIWEPVCALTPILQAIDWFYGWYIHRAMGHIGGCGLAVHGKDASVELLQSLADAGMWTYVWGVKNRAALEPGLVQSMRRYNVSYTLGVVEHPPEKERLVET